MKRKHITMAMVGSDGLQYRGKAVKKRRRLEDRIASFEKSMASTTLESRKKKSLRKPGSMK